MAHTHSHSPSVTFACTGKKNGNGADRSKEKRRLFWCMVITALTMFLEFFGGFWTGSLALISDAAHMFSDLFSFGVSFIAILVAMKEPDEARSFGFYRAEIIAALFNGFTLIMTVCWIIYEAIARLMHPSVVATKEMLLIATVGLFVNFASAMLLKNVSEKNLNIKSAFLHNLFDTLSSIAIIIAGILIYFTGKYWLDPAISIFVSLLILVSTIPLIRDAVYILLEATPKELSCEKIVTALKQEVPEIRDINHIHIWELTSNLYSFMAHVQVDDVKISESELLRQRINHILEAQFGITHTNLQFEVKK